MMFAISISMASLLLRVSGDESGVFHLYGRASGVGKGLLELVGLSVHGAAIRNELLHWDATDTGIDELAAEHCDRLLVLDELGRLADDPKTAAAKAQRVSFKIAAGIGRIRSVNFGNKGNLCRWRVFVLSSGELAISEMANAAGKNRLKGDQVRMIDIPADANSKFGIFDHLPDGQSSSKSLAAQIETAASQNFGHPSRILVKRILSLGDDRIAARIKRAKKRFMKAAGVPQDKWDQRFAQRFGLAYAGAEVGIQFGILPWKRKTALRAIRSVYRDARRAVPDFAALTAEALAEVKRELAKATQFCDLRPGKEKANQPKASAAAGFIKKDKKSGSYFVVNPSALQKWVGDKIDARWVVEALADQGLLIKSKGNVLTKQVLIPSINGKHRYYCIRRRFLR
jgi:putative DNA primase/helicase